MSLSTIYVTQMIYICKCNSEVNMSKTTMIHARVEPELKSEVESVFKEIGLNMTTAVTLFLKQVVMHKGLPFNVNIPNAETLEAMQETLSRKGQPGKHKNADEFFKSIGLEE